MFHISRLKKAADKSKARELETPKWMRQGFPDKITNEDQDYEVSHILGHHDYKPEGDCGRLAPCHHKLKRLAAAAR